MIRLRTKIPGPRAMVVVKDDAKVISPSYTRYYPLVVERGRGMYVEDVDGNRFLDFTAGVAVCTTGHAHPDVVRAVRAQAGRFMHMAGTDFYWRGEGYRQRSPGSRRGRAGYFQRVEVGVH